MKISTILQGKKRYAAAAVAAATLGGGAFAFANTLGVSSNTLGAGSAPSVASPASVCNPSFSYTTVWSTTVSAFVVDSVTATTTDVADAASCSKDSIQAEITGTGGSPLPFNLAAKNYTAGGAGVADSASWTGLATNNVLASAVTGISGVVTGAS